MKYEHFVEKMRLFPLIDRPALASLDDHPRTLANLLSLWVHRGKLIKLRRGFYVLPEKASPLPLPGPVAAQTLYFPSYLSLEFALSHYELIPEQVFEYTSITTRKTMRFSNALGRFSYFHIKASRFFGFSKVEAQGLFYFLAWPEKALLDWIYLDNRRVMDPEDYIEILRLQNRRTLSSKRLTEIALRFQSRKIVRVAQVIARSLR